MSQSINLRKLPEEFIQRIHLAAVTKGITLREFVISAIEQALKAEEPHASE